MGVTYKSREYIVAPFMLHIIAVQIGDFKVEKHRYKFRDQFHEAPLMWPACNYHGGVMPMHGKCLLLYSERIQRKECFVIPAPVL